MLWLEVYLVTILICDHSFSLAWEGVHPQLADREFVGNFGTTSSICCYHHDAVTMRLSPIAKVILVIQNHICTV
jgi:hypothetical protein